MSEIQGGAALQGLQDGVLLFPVSGASGLGPLPPISAFIFMQLVLCVCVSLLLGTC